MKVLADLDPAHAVPAFLHGYTELDEVPHPDGHELVALKGPLGYYSIDTLGHPNPNVSPVGWSQSAGVFERFNALSGAYVHDVTGLAIPRSGVPALLP